MKVLVTGGAGFVGSHIVDLLIQEDFAVTVLDNLSTGVVDNINPKASFVKMDIRDERLKTLLLEERFDYVIHEAAQTTVTHSMEEPSYDCDVNVRGMVNLLEACRLSGVKRIVFASSAAIYGDTEEFPIREDFSKEPLSFYGESKLTGERYLDLYYKNFGLEYVVLRYANVYGPRQGNGGEGGVISIFLKRLFAGEEVTIYGDGSQTRDFVYAKDVARANLKALFTDCANRAYNISSMREISIQEVAMLIGRITDRRIEIRYEAKRERDIVRSVLDHHDANVGLRWRPKYTLQEGLTEMCLVLDAVRQEERNCWVS